MLRTILLPATAFAASLAMLLLLSPAGVIGDPRVTTATSSSDRYALGHDMNIETPVGGSVFVFGGSAQVANTVDGDLFVIGGNVTFAPAGRVRGNVIHGGQLVNAQGRVGGSAYPLTSVQGATASLTKTAVVLSLLFFWIVGAVILTLFSGREIRASSVEIRSSALYCFTLGLVAVTSFVLTAIVFSYLVPYLVGIPLLAGLGVFAALTKIYGMVAVFHALGSIVAGSRSREQLDRRKWLRGDLAMVLIGVLILGAIRLIPGVGTIAWSVASVFGVGVALATKFGRREPWFLAWRHTEAEA
jgi:preprotein translocase subunit SecG